MGFVAQAMWSVAQAMWACCTGFVEKKLIIRQSQPNLAEVEVGAELGNNKPKVGKLSIINH